MDKFNHIFARQTRASSLLTYCVLSFQERFTWGRERSRSRKQNPEHTQEGTRIRKRGSGTRFHASRLRSILSIRVELANVIDFRSKQIYRWLGPSRLHVLTRNALEYRILTV